MGEKVPGVDKREIFIPQLGFSRDKTQNTRKLMNTLNGELDADNTKKYKVTLQEIW